MPTSPKKYPALLRDYEAHHHPLIRPAIKALFPGEGGFGGVPLDSHDIIHAFIRYQMEFPIVDIISKG